MKSAAFATGLLLFLIVTVSRADEGPEMIRVPAGEFVMGDDTRGGGPAAFPDGYDPADHPPSRTSPGRAQPPTATGSTCAPDCRSPTTTTSGPA